MGAVSTGAFSNPRIVEYRGDYTYAGQGGQTPPESSRDPAPRRPGLQFCALIEKGG